VEIPRSQLLPGLLPEFQITAAQGCYLSRLTWRLISICIAQLNINMPDMSPVATYCVSCGEKETPSETLRRCSRCHGPIYCSRACQKAHWRTHKSVCILEALNNNYYFDTLPLEDDVMDQLIDAYRMRVTDDHKYQGDNHGLYIGEDPLVDFKGFLNRAEAQMSKERQGDVKRSGILPSWWSPEKRTVCEQRAMRRDFWSNLYSAVEKHHIQEHYVDNLMPMKLRMLAEAVYGFTVGGPRK
jgi:mitochondrial splicing suppressor protein 51